MSSWRAPIPCRSPAPHLAFTPSGSNPADDPAVQFSTGGRSATFTIPANATHATFGAPSFGIQAGSSMGSIAVSLVSLSAAGISLPVPGGVAQTASVPRPAGDPQPDTHPHLRGDSTGPRRSETPLVS